MKGWGGRALVDADSLVLRGGASSVGGSVVPGGDRHLVNKQMEYEDLGKERGV